MTSIEAEVGASGVSVGENPFVGPKPIERGQAFFGRSLEVDQLYDQLCADRIVLLYSPSGAGKSSLIQAGLVPRLSANFDVWPTTRVNSELPTGVAALDPKQTVNRYVASAILGFEAGLPKHIQRPVETIAPLSLSDYVAGRPRRRNAPKLTVLLFDQFEEVLTADPLAIEQKREFFRQLGGLLEDNPQVWALFALREDYLAAFDPYAEAIPTHLGSRFRLDLLRVESAKQAIQASVESAGRGFAAAQPGEAGPLDKLVSDLATIQVQQPDGSFQDGTGRYVEPLHLQIVCRGLWNGLPQERTSIEAADIAQLGNVTLALKDYYTAEVRKHAGGDQRAERSIRDWFGRQLITPAGVRSQVLYEAEKSGGLENERIWPFVNDSHLVRAEKRTGETTWFELAHDRLIRAVRESNRDWFVLLSSLQQRSSVWAEQKEPEGLLFVGRELVEAQLWASKHPEWTTGTDLRFLKASRARNRNRILLRVAIYVAFNASLLAIAGGSWAWWKSRQARIALAEAAVADVPASLSSGREEETDIALARLGRAITYDPSSLAARAWISDLLTRRRWWLPSQSFAQKNMSSSDLSNDGKLVAAGSKDGIVQIWDAVSGQQIATPFQAKGPVFELFFSPSGRHLMVISGRFAQMIDTKTCRQVGATMQNAGDIEHARFSKDGMQAITTSGNTAILWDSPTGKPLGKPLVHADTINSAVFSQDGQWVLTASRDGTAKIWRASDGSLSGSTPTPHKAIAYADFSPDSLFFVTSSYTNGQNQDKSRMYGVAEVWTMPLGGSARPTLASTLKQSGRVKMATFDPQDGDTILLTAESNQAILWDWSHCDLPVGMPGVCPDANQPKALSQNGILWGAYFSDNGMQILTGSYDNTIQAWNAHTAEPIGSPIPYGVGAVTGLNISDDGEHVLTSTEVGGAQIWEMQLLKQGAGESLADNYRIDSLVRSSAGLRLIALPEQAIVPVSPSVGDVANPDASLYTYQLLNASGEPWGRAITLANSFSPVLAQDGHHALWVQAGDASHKTTLQVWDFVTGRPVGPVFVGLDAAQDYDLSANGTRVLMWTPDAVQVYDSGTGKALGGFQRNGNADISISRFSPKGNSVVTAYWDGAQIWDAATGKSIGAELQQHQGWIADAGFSPDGNMVYAVSDDRIASIYSASTGKPIGKPMEHSGKVLGAAFSPDGNRILTETSNHLLQMWDARRDVKVGAPVHLGDAYTRLEISPDGNMLLTFSGTTAQVWDVKTGKAIGERFGMQGAPPTGQQAADNNPQADGMADLEKGVGAFSADGREVVVVSHEDMKARVYRVLLGSGQKSDNQLLGDLAAVVSGYTVNEATNAPEPVDPQKRLIEIDKLRKRYKIPANERFLEYFVQRLSAPLPTPH